MKSSSLPRVATALALAMLASLFLTLATRSVWVDEAMLLKDIIALDSAGEFFRPLPYYDQAEPVLASLFFKAIISLFHYDIEPLRLSVLALSCLLIAPTVLTLRRYRWGVALFLLILIGHSFSMGLFLTELKHYFLEVSVSFLAIFALWQADEHDNLYWPIGMAALISVLGFSTLIVSGALLIYACLLFSRRPRDVRSKPTVIAWFASALTIVAAYAFMKYLAQFQLTNYDDYHASSALAALAMLKEAVLGAYGKALLIVSGVANLALLLRRQRDFLFRLNLFFLGIALVVVAGRIIGFYPVSYPRHVIWLAPFSMVIACCAILEFIPAPSRAVRLLGWALLTVLTLQAGKAVYNNVKGVNYAYVDNNALYQYVAELPPTEFLVYPDAVPSLEFYSLIDQRLSKHHYTWIYDETTKRRDPAQGRAEYQASLTELLQQRPASDFSMLVSHINLDTDTSERGIALKEEINRLNCTYTSYFYVYNAQLIRVHCPLGAQL
ncbi:hypothetical protein ACIPL1_14420 [Pseudomonas sp. NPDC090202]|uniref:hypothetical protein n=1 Tax=unclassified Pseudomonas TaxID=196821 RepID=UPI00380A1330